jgi:hypothetical protein
MSAQNFLGTSVLLCLLFIMDIYIAGRTVSLSHWLETLLLRYTAFSGRIEQLRTIY